MNKLFAFFYFILFLVYPWHIPLKPIFQKEVIAETKVDSTFSATISFVGDLMCHSVQYNYARTGKDSFDFTPVYRYIKEYLSEPDIMVGNLETVIGGKKAGYSGYPFFNSPDEYVFALKEAGFDFLTTANNHSLDRGEAGVLRTIDILNQNKLLYNGTYTTQADRDSLRILNINNIKIAMLAYTYGTNGVKIPKGKDYLINLIDYSKIETDISIAKSSGVDIVLVHFHFGEEYKREPNNFQKEVVNKTIQFGADIIIGGHPHVLQPIDYFHSEKSNLDSVFVAYSLGNFVSNQRWRYSDAGAILNIRIEKDIYGSVQLKEINFLPTWVYKGNTGIKNEYIILPSERFADTTLIFLKSEDRRLMQQAFEDSKEIMTKYSKINLKSVYHEIISTGEYYGD